MRVVSTTLVAAAALSVVALAAAVDPHRVPAQPQPPMVGQVETGAATWLTQPPDQLFTLVSDAGCDICGGSAQVLADNFAMSSGGIGVDISQAIVWGGYYLGTWPPAANFEVVFHTDSAGMPGDVVCQASVLPTSDVLTGVTVGGVSEHQVTLDFPGCTLADGTYFVEIYTDTGFGTDDWFWESGEADAVHGIPGHAYAFQAPGASWSYSPSPDMAVTLNGDPVSVVLQSCDIEYPARCRPQHCEPRRSRRGWLLFGLGHGSEYPHSRCTLVAGSCTSCQ